MISSVPKWVSTLFGDSMRPNVIVFQTHYITAYIKRIRFQGDISKWNFHIGYASVIRVSESEFRNYTIEYHDKELGFFDIIFHIHGNGVGSHYIDSLNIGDEIFIGPPRGKSLYVPSRKQYYIFGDETSLGLACTFLPVLKQNGHHFHFCFELDDANKNVPKLLNLENYSVFAKTNLFNNEKWIDELSFFKTSGLMTTIFVLTGNARSVQTFRYMLKKNKGVEISSQGYWLAGKKGL
ncbi:FAD-binding oxidoreductase [Flavobacterium olei]|uniref:FAD-binding oxidoreductase n=1 Tax=Flavobacterium olei TaxID=1886782 RepID=UPI00321BF735